MTTLVPASMTAEAVTQAQIAALSGPLFSAYVSTASQALSTGVFTKVLCQTKEFDTTSAYDNATNYRFQPLQAGYYLISGACVFSGTCTQGLATIYKNGSEFKRGAAVALNTGGTTLGATASALVYLNGSTDYVELWAYAVGSSLSLTGSSAAYTYFQGMRVR